MKFLKLNWFSLAEDSFDTDQKFQFKRAKIMAYQTMTYIMNT